MGVRSKAYTIEASDGAGTRAFAVRTAREAIDTIADLLNADFAIERLVDHNGDTVDYDHIARASLDRWP